MNVLTSNCGFNYFPSCFFGFFLESSQKSYGAKEMEPLSRAIHRDCAVTRESKQLDKFSVAKFALPLAVVYFLCPIKWILLSPLSTSNSFIFILMTYFCTIDHSGFKELHYCSQILWIGILGKAPWGWLISAIFGNNWDSWLGLEDPRWLPSDIRCFSWGNYWLKSIWVCLLYSHSCSYAFYMTSLFNCTALHGSWLPS